LSGHAIIICMSNPKRPRDTNQLAKSIVDLTTGDAPENEKKPREVSQSKSDGGAKGAKSRNENLTPEQRSEIAKKAARARWHKKN